MLRRTLWVLFFGCLCVVGNHPFIFAGFFSSEIADQSLSSRLRWEVKNSGRFSLLTLK